MAKEIFNGKFFRITHTSEPAGPHPTILHDYYDRTFTITALLRGNGSCRIEGNCYSLSDGDMVLIGPEEIRSFHFCDDGYHERISLYFSSAVLSPLWEYELPVIQMFRAHPPGIGNKYTARGQDRVKIESIFREICKWMKDSDTETADAMPEARIHLLLLQLLFTLYDTRDKYELSAANYNGDRIIWDICRYICEHLKENLTHQHLQDRFSVSRYQLTEIFHRNTGMTLTEYIILKRLIKVTALVRSGSGIEAAAFEAGFGTYSHFYKEFVKYHHISPRKYYANQKENT